LCSGPTTFFLSCFLSSATSPSQFWWPFSFLIGSRLQCKFHSCNGPGLAYRHDKDTLGPYSQQQAAQFSGKVKENAILISWASTPMEGSPRFPVLPPLTVSKAVVIFVQNLEFGQLEHRRHEHLDRLAQHGCSGLLHPRRHRV